MTQLYKKGFIKEVDGSEPINLMNQAKAMEKEQNYNLDNLRDAYRWGTTVSIGTSDHFEEFVNNIKIK